MFNKGSRGIGAAVMALSFAAQTQAQTIEIDGQPVRIEDTGLSLQQAQDAMDPLRLIAAYVVDKAGPRNERGGWGERADNVYAVAEQIDAVIYLANVGKHNPGQPDNPQEMELYINIRDMEGNIVFHARPVHTFEGVRRLQDPLQEDYFRDRFTVSARVPEAGQYDVGFVFIDRTRPADKQIVLEVPLEVVITEQRAAMELTDLVALIMRGDADQSYLLRRCAAYFRSQIEFAGPDSFSDAQFSAVNAKFRYFLGADVMINAGFNGVSVEQASDETLAAMREISVAYLMRMKRYDDAGEHPWGHDLMLRRDEAGCTVLYDQRDRQ